MTINWYLQKKVQIGSILTAANATITLSSHFINNLTNLYFFFCSLFPSVTYQSSPQDHAAHTTSFFHPSRHSVTCAPKTFHLTARAHLCLLVLPALCPHFLLCQVRLTEDLAASTARLSQLQLEASAQQQKAVELQTKLNSALQDNENHGQKVTTLQTQLEGLSLKAM